MCTVSFINSNGKIIITSNRDEQIIRPNAIEPKSYLLNNKKVIFPKDSKAGGTWFAVDETGNVLVLLNGAEEKHDLQNTYRKSRGLIALDIIGSNSPKDFWHEINLENIEPFTLVLFQNNELFQLRWNGFVKETLLLDAKKNHIWSSATLYSKEIREKRSNWFYTFLDENSVIDEKKMLKFHRYTEENNPENGLVINRNDKLKTLSITQIVIEKSNVTLSHFDLITQNEYETSMTII